MGPDNELALIKARVNAATEEPWRVGADREYWAKEPSPQFGQLLVGTTTMVEGPIMLVAEINSQRADAEFIAHARSDIPRLLAFAEAVINWDGSPEIDDACFAVEIAITRQAIRRLAEQHLGTIAAPELPNV